jgi:hypothetical protein
MWFSTALVAEDVNKKFIICTQAANSINKCPSIAKGIPVTTSNDSGQPLSNDLLEGAQQIADYIGLGKRRTDYAIQNGRIPVFRIGCKIFARKSELHARLSASYKSDDAQ